MCGIAGIISDKPVGEEYIWNAIKSMGHRGPDNHGACKISPNVALGHARLSIISRDSKSNQPFRSPDGRHTIVFNGEIYNYIELRERLKGKWNFETQSDTEVLLAAFVNWGIESLDMLKGMFSFGIWDNREKTLILVRDRFGVKPLYYRIKKNEFEFASEIKGLWANNKSKTLNKTVCSSFLAYGSYGTPEETFWEGVQQVPAGHFVKCSRGEVTKCCWYKFEDKVMAHQSNKNDEEYIEQLLYDSVKLRFRADVPVGINISGGIDSSALLASVKKIFDKTKNIRAFTFFTDNINYDEIKWVSGMLEYVDCPLTKCLLKVADVPEMTKNLMSYHDEPFGGIPTIAYSNIFKASSGLGYKVLLDGQGADESWAGYDYYANNSGNIVQGVKGSPLDPDILDHDYSSLGRPLSYKKPFNDSLLNLQYRDLFYTKLPRALRFNDRSSMMHGVELREPFLDHELVEKVFSLPRSKKIYNGVQKWLLRKISEKVLDQSIAWAPKRPIQTPQREWLTKELRPWVTDVLLEVDKTGWFKKGQLIKRYEDICSRPINNSFSIWQWISVAYLNEIEQNTHAL